MAHRCTHNHVYQRRGFRPASQEQAKALVRKECPAGFR
jgi:hypothetical protein